MKTKLHIVIIITLSLVCLILSTGGNVALSAWQAPIGNEEDSNSNSGQQIGTTKDKIH